MSHAPDQWIRRASQGDDAAIAHLIERYLPDLRAYVSHRLGPVLGVKESAADVVQSCCREVLQHLDRFQYDQEEGFRRWLYATALRKLRDHQRHFAAGKRDVAKEASAGRDPGGRDLRGTRTTPSQDAIRREDQDKVRTVLQELSPADRDIITRAYFEQASHGEIAEELGITVNNARVRLSRALGRLARLLGTEE